MWVPGVKLGFHDWWEALSLMSLPAQPTIPFRVPLSMHTHADGHPGFLPIGTPSVGAPSPQATIPISICLMSLPRSLGFATAPSKALFLSAISVY